MAPTHAARMSTGTASDVGHSMSLVLSVHLALVISSCALAWLARAMACCLSALILLKSGRHGAGPLVGLMRPGAHSVHVSPFAPENPALHSHIELAAGEDEFARQVWHVPGPAPVLNVPPWQTEHAAPSAPE